MTKISGDDREILKAYIEGSSEPGPTPHPNLREVDTGPLHYPWRDGRGTVTLEMCNAIRCAAHEGVSYTRIAEMFDALSNRSHARRHAMGLRCAHDGVEPVSEARHTGPKGKLSTTDCAVLTRRYESGEYDTYKAAGEDFDISRPVAAKHIKGDCRH